MLRGLVVLASVALVAASPHAAGRPAAPDPRFIEGAWSGIEAPVDSPADANAEAKAQIDRVFPLEGARVADAQLAVGIRNELDFALGRLLAEMHFVRIGLTADRAVIVDDMGRNEYSLAAKAETHTISGVGVHVTAIWTAPSLVLDVAGDHGLRVRETLEPNVDAAQLLVRWELLSPKTQLPLVVTRRYRRLSAEPPSSDRVIAGDLVTEVAPQPGGGVSITEAITRSLDPTRPTVVLLAARPTWPIRLRLVRVSFGPADVVDLQAPGAVQIIVGRGLRHSAGPDLELPVANPQGAPFTSRYGTHPLGLTLDVSHGTATDRRHCVLPVRFDSDSPYDAGKVSFSAGTGSSAPDGVTPCGSTPDGFAFRLTYEHGTHATAPPK